jgi:hypothetical protein
MTVRRHSALVLLAGLGIKGRVRLIGRSFKTLRGIIAFLLGFGMFSAWIAVWVVGMFVRPDRRATAGDAEDFVSPDNLRLYIALLLLGYCLVTFLFRRRGIGIHFRPAEIDLLFPAPYHRRELLLYKLASSLAGVVISAAIFSLFMSWIPVPWPILFLGLFLAISFALLVNILAAILALALSVRLYTRLRQAAVLGIAAIAVVAGLWIRQLYAEDPPQWDITLAQRPAVQVLLAPFMVFARAVTAPDFIAFAPHALLALVINLGIVLLILVLDADYYESSIATTRKTYERLRRIRQGDIFASELKGTRTRSLPELPRLRGVGPIAWRQATTAVRSLPRLLLVLLIIGVPLALVVFGSEFRVMGMGLMYLAFMVFLFMPSAFRFDFRSDLNKMSWLKSLPVSSWAVVVGQLLPATILLLLIQAGLVGTIAFSFSVWEALALLPVLPAAAFIAFAIDNFLFLLFPTRRTAMYPGDFQNLGFAYLVGFVKIITFMLIFGLAAAAGAAAYFASGHSLVITSAVVTVLLTILACAWIPLLSWAYDRFDPATDVPVD